eukprot:scaffold372791_cov42-Prasinocladus_malaysianus.AAC.1
MAYGRADGLMDAQVRFSYNVGYNCSIPSSADGAREDRRLTYFCRRAQSSMWKLSNRLHTPAGAAVADGEGILNGVLDPSTCTFEVESVLNGPSYIQGRGVSDPRMFRATWIDPSNPPDMQSSAVRERTYTVVQPLENWDKTNSPEVKTDAAVETQSMMLGIYNALATAEDRMVLPRVQYESRSE